MADPEEDKNKAATPSEPGKRSEQNDETDTNIRLQSAAEKPPSNEATEDLLELLGTVGSAGLGASVIAAKIAPPPQPASQQTPTNATPTTSQPTELLQQAPTPESARHEDDNISEPISKPEHISNTRTMSNEFFAQTLQPPPLADQRNLQNRVAGLDKAKAGSLGRHRKSEPNKKIQKEDAIEQGDAIESHNPSATTAAIEQYSASEQFVDEHHTKQANNEVSETEASVHQRNDEHLEKAPNEASSQHITSKDYANDSSANGAADTADIPPDATSSPTSQIQPANKSQEAVLRTVTKFRSELYPNGVPEAVKTEDKDTDIDSSPPLSDRFADQARKSMRALAQLIPDRENQTKFQTIAPGAVNEISNGTLGSATVAIFAIAERLGLVEPLLEGYREIAKNGSSSLEILQHNKQAREIHMRIRGAAPAAVAQRFILRLVPKTTAELKAQFTLRDKLDIDPLTTRSRPPDMDYGSGLEIDTLARAKQISQALIDAPSSVEIENIELPPQNLHLLEFARAQGASGDNLNLYLRYAFYKTNSPRIRQEAMQGLRDEVLSGDNPSAIYVFQEVWINKALIELKEYQRQNDEQGILEALTQIIALEDSAPQLRPIIQNLAGEFRDRAVGQATVQQAHRATSEIAQTTFASASQAYTSSLIVKSTSFSPSGAKTNDSMPFCNYAWRQSSA